MSILRLNIDVSKLDKSAFFKGQKGTYADLTVLLKDNGEEDQYGNHGMVVQDLGRERREKGEKGPILGNAKFAGQTPQNQSSGQQTASQPSSASDMDEIPFAQHQDGW